MNKNGRENKDEHVVLINEHIEDRGPRDNQPFRFFDGRGEPIYTPSVKNIIRDICVLSGLALCCFVVIGIGITYGILRFDNHHEPPSSPSP